MGANAGSVKGAIAGYVASRATKAVARAILNFRGSGSGDSQRVVRVYGKGKYWDSLKRAPKLGQKSGGGQVRIDSNGFAYKFDPAHKTEKIHLHKYKNKGGDKWKLIEEIDPETGALMKVVKDGKIETWG